MDEEELVMSMGRFCTNGVTTVMPQSAFPHGTFGAVQDVPHAFGFVRAKMLRRPDLAPAFFALTHKNCQKTKSTCIGHAWNGPRAMHGRRAFWPATRPATWPAPHPILVSPVIPFPKTTALHAVKEI